MKITCNREEFTAKFNLAAAYVAARELKTALQNVKMDVKSGRVVFSATDTETSVRVTLRDVKRITLSDAEIGSERAAFLPPRLMNEILQSAESENIALELKDGVIRISAGQLLYEIPALDTEDFPDIPPFAGAAYHEVIGADLQKSISRTAFATDTENNKHVLSGVLFELAEGGIDTVSTDGRRLAHQHLKAVSHGGHSADNSAVVPLKALAAVEKAIDEVGADTSIKIAAEGGNITFAAANGEITITSQAVDGRFPAWRKIIPDKTDCVRADVPLRDFQAAVHHLKGMTTKELPGLLLDFKPGTLEISAGGNTDGTSARAIPIAYDRKEISTKLDPNYLVDFLGCISGETSLSICLKENSSVLFEIPHDSGYAYVLMPLA